MKTKQATNRKRRELLKLVGGGVAFATVAGLAGCSDGGSEPSSLAQPSKADPKPEPTPEPAPQAAPEPAAPEPEPMAAQSSPEPAAGGMPALSESDPQAQALGYRNDTNEVDTGKFPTHSSDQACANCLLFAGNAGDASGPCGIFPGRSVNAKGWCSAYSKKG